MDRGSSWRTQGHVVSNDTQQRPVDNDDKQTNAAMTYTQMMVEMDDNTQPALESKDTNATLSALPSGQSASAQTTNAGGGRAKLTQNIYAFLANNPALRIAFGIADLTSQTLQVSRLLDSAIAIDDPNFQRYLSKPNFNFESLGEEFVQYIRDLKQWTSCVEPRTVAMHLITQVFKDTLSTDAAARARFKQPAPWKIKLAEELMRCEQSASNDNRNASVATMLFIINMCFTTDARNPGAVSGIVDQISFVNSTFARTTPPTCAGAANYTADVLDLTHDDGETVPGMVTESMDATLPAEPSATVMQEFSKKRRNPDISEPTILPTPEKSRKWVPQNTYAASRAVSEKNASANDASAHADVEMTPSDKTQLARGELIPELKSVLRDVHLDPRILEKAVLQSSPDTVPSWSEEYQRTLLDGDLTHLLQEVQAAGACLAESPASSTSYSWLGDAHGMRAYFLLELWVHRSGVRAFPASFQSLRESLSVSYEKARTVSRVGVYFEYKSFEDARAYVRTLRLKSMKEWNAWKKSGGRPHDIPANPEKTYKESGWTSYGDFLGFAVGTVSGSLRSFEEARACVRTFRLKSAKEFKAWKIQGAARTAGIPTNPEQEYKSSGWTSWGDFLGYSDDNVSASYRSFEHARAYVRTLGLKSFQEWKAWSKSGDRPHDIPRHPYTTYESSGWLSMGDFLGFAVGKVAGAYREFEDARAYVRSLGLKSQREWEAWRKSGVRPHDIPSTPERTYKSSGWISWGDFLGYAIGKQIQIPKTSKFRSFEGARAYARTLGLKSKKEWEEWRTSGARPHDIPSTPETTYKSSGWASWGDFLGFAGSYRSFEDARAYVRTLGLKSKMDWNTWKKSGARPRDIPGNPETTYKSSGWTSYGDFLGYAEGQGARGSFRSFEDARAYVRTLGLKSQKEWKAWRKSDARPTDIPSGPETTYKSSGWMSFGDFLGYADGTVASSFRSFGFAREYVRTLGLKSQTEWQAWSSSGARPPDIPISPQTTYASSGWTSYGDFLGYVVGQGARGSFRSFEDARMYARTLGLKSQKDWFAWGKSGARPPDIPANPDRIYKSSGWTSYGDFLGYADGKVALTRKRKVRA